MEKMENTKCPGCGLLLPKKDLGLSTRYQASGECEELLGILDVYALLLHDEEFIHQIVVNTYAAQHSGPKMKDITLYFALVGLYLSIERGYTGRQVQSAHMKLGRNKQKWPHFEAPKIIGSITIKDVLATEEGLMRNEAIHTWAKIVWEGWKNSHAQVKDMVVGL
jgi:hypothetical protein